MQQSTWGEMGGGKEGGRGKQRVPKMGLEREGGRREPGTAST